MSVDRPDHKTTSRNLSGLFRPFEVFLRVDLWTGGFIAIGNDPLCFLRPPVGFLLSGRRILDLEVLMKPDIQITPDLVKVLHSVCRHVRHDFILGCLSQDQTRGAT